MEVLGPKVRVALEHLPILVAGDQADLLDGVLRLEQSAGGLVTEVMEVQVLDPQLPARTPERRPHGPGVVGKGALALAAERFLFLQQGPGVEPGGVEQGDLLVIAGLVARVLAIAHHHRAADDVDIFPENPADLLLPHRRRDGELDDAAHGNELPRVGVEIGDDPVEFVDGGPPVALAALADQAEALQGDARQIDRLRRDLNAVDGGAWEMTSLI